MDLKEKIKVRRRFTPRFGPRAEHAMNGLEKRYSQYLEGLRVGGEVLEWRYEALKLRLGDATFFTPDFIVVYPDRIEAHECKGFLEEAASVRIRVAATQFWYMGFVMVRWDAKAKQFTFKRYGAGE